MFHKAYFLFINALVCFCFSFHCFLGVTLIRPDKLTLFTTTLGLPGLLRRMEKLTQATDLRFNATLHVDFFDIGSVMLFIYLSVCYYSVVLSSFLWPPSRIVRAAG